MSEEILKEETLSSEPEVKDVQVEEPKEESFKIDKEAWMREQDEDKSGKESPDESPVIESKEPEEAVTETVETVTEDAKQDPNVILLEEIRALKSEISALKQPKEEQKEVPVEQKYPGLPPEPTEEQWIENPSKAFKQAEARKEYIQQKNAEEFQKREIERVQYETYRNKRQETWSETQKKYPELKDKNSELFKLAEKILKENPTLEADPRCDLHAVREAKEILESRKGKGKTINKNASFMVQGGKGTAAPKQEGFDESKFLKMDRQKQREVMREMYFGKAS